MPAAVPPPLFLVLAGPAGSGKSTLCDRLLAERPEFSRVVTATTRTPRPGEVDGVHYHFLAPAEFRRRVTAGDFLEWAQVHGDRDDRLYGTPRASVREPLAAGRSLAINVDVQGVESFRRAATGDALLRRCMITVFIVVDHARMVERMRARAKDDEAEIARRLATAEIELREAPKFDFRIDSRTRDEDFAALLGIVDRARAAVAQ
jgi:guanylate kinase